jgi:hypothetical protein
MSCCKMDIWLAAHLTDVLDKMALVDDDETAYVYLLSASAQLLNHRLSVSNNTFGITW